MRINHKKVILNGRAQSNRLIEIKTLKSNEIILGKHNSLKLIEIQSLRVDSIK